AARSHGTSRARLSGAAAMASFRAMVRPRVTMRPRRATGATDQQLVRPQPNAGTLSGLADELDAGGLQGADNRLDGTAPRLPLPCLQPHEGPQRDATGLSQLVLRPIE